MLRPWMRFLPFALVAWIGRRQCEQVPAGAGMTGVEIFRGQVLSWPSSKQGPRRGA